MLFLLTLIFLFYYQLFKNIFGSNYKFWKKIQIIFSILISRWLEIKNCLCSVWNSEINFPKLKYFLLYRRLETFSEKMESLKSYLCCLIPGVSRKCFLIEFDWLNLLKKGIIFVDFIKLNLFLTKWIKKNIYFYIF